MLQELESCVVLIGDRKTKLKGSVFNALAKWIRESGINLLDILTVEEFVFYIPEIDKRIRMVFKHRPDLGLSSDGNVYYGTTPLTREEQEILKKHHPKLAFHYETQEMLSYVS